MRYLAIDLGLKRIGLALSVDGTMATPLDAIIRKNRNQAAREVTQVLNEWQIEAIVVGMPFDGDSYEVMRKRIEHFLGLLTYEKVPIYYQDENLSSVEAKERMKGVIRQKRDGRIDSIAAQIILERFLSEKRTTNQTH